MSDDLKILVAQEVAKQLAAIAADQTTKKVLDFLKNRNSADAYIVETGGDSTSWYRRYSDGWLEQGGITGTLSFTVTFPKAFSNTDYQFVATKYWSSGTAVWNPQAHPTNATLKTNTSIRVVTGGDYYVAMWVAFGYGES